MTTEPLRSEPLSALTALAIQAYRNPHEGYPDFLSAPDPILNEATRISSARYPRGGDASEAMAAVLDDPDLAPLRPVDGLLDPMVLHRSGGFRASAESLVHGLLSSAALRLFFFGEPGDEASFVRAVIENYEELRRAARGERVRVYSVTGIGALELERDVIVTTPWGVLRPAPPTPERFDFFGPPKATSILVTPSLDEVRLDRASEPEPRLPDAAEIASQQRPGLLFPLAAALAFPDQQAAPIMTWSTFVIPFGGGLGWSFPHLGPTFPPTVHIGPDDASNLASWCMTLEQGHHVNVEVAARRLVSAISLRNDRADALIDAVMVWENLVGTSSETSFRVTASLAKLTEDNRAQRRELQKSLQDLYNLRSRVVHGDEADGTKVDAARGVETMVAHAGASAAHPWHVRDACVGDGALPSASTAKCSSPNGRSPARRRVVSFSPPPAER